MHRPEEDNGHAVVKDVRCCCRPELSGLAGPSKTNSQIIEYVVLLFIHYSNLSPTEPY